ncbi:Papain-like cysteine protease AvrRpt2 [Caprobacter fermentans]|uniref:Papain-like cysteine protease AvrRpt2 n=1 Tax=Caproicibacter fermentans TaxID=2576756 RepID=A0A6N8I2L7_9FIRM|nr:Papain-like cysteine protease AvrRpt2 [Caproicibacter fermentans]
MKTYQYGDANDSYGYDDEYEYEFDNGYDEKPRRKRRRRKRRHPLRWLILIVLAAVCVWKLPFFKQGIRSLTAPASGIYEQHGDSATADDGLKSGTVSADTAEALEAMAEADPKALPIVQNPGQYPQRLLESLGRNSELLDFTLDYPKKKGTYSKNIDLSKQSEKGQVPLFIQWDEQWGYAPYGDGIIALDGCGPTCLSMVAVNLTGDTSKNPKAVADYSAKNGYLDRKSNSTLWTLMSDGAENLGLSSREIPLSESRITEELSQGRPIICCMGPGDFTTQGHFIVLCGVQSGKFTVHDPNSRKRSEETWSYDTLKPQIRNLWAFSAPR